MPRVAVIGGGVSGLSAALRLQDLSAAAGAPLDVTLLEAADRVGGCVQTVERDGLLMELGADSLLAAKPAAQWMLLRLNLLPQTVQTPARFKGARIVRGRRLRRIPPDFRLFAPRSIPALLRAGIFSPAGLARAALEPFIPARKVVDESLASFVTRRFGREVLDRLAQPIVGGIYSADPQHLSMQATLPEFLNYERRFGSVFAGLRQAAVTSPPAHLVSLSGGLGTLVQAIERELEARIRTNAAVARVERFGREWTVVLADGSTLVCDAVICALQAPDASRILAPMDARIASQLARITCNSIATINLAYDAASVRLPASTGFVVPQSEGRLLAAATFSSQKYPGRSADDTVLIRAFAGGAFGPDHVHRSNAELAAGAHSELQSLIRVTSEPKSALIQRWNNVLPQYEVGHVGQILALSTLVAGIPGLALAGCAYAGVGIPDCIASGQAAGDTIFGYLR